MGNGPPEAAAAALGAGGAAGPVDVGQTPVHGNYAIETTWPEREIRHNISDLELDMLQKGQSDQAFNVMLAAGGAAVGAAPQVARDLYGAFRAATPVPLDLASVFVLLIFGGALTAAGVAYMFWKQRTSPVDAKVAEIRERTNRTLHLIRTGDAAPRRTGQT